MCGIVEIRHILHIYTYIATNNHIKIDDYEI